MPDGEGMTHYNYVMIAVVEGAFPSKGSTSWSWTYKEIQIPKGDFCRGNAEM
jgi:hypothetical protein